ncbi:MAG: hypothetical protein HZA68_00415 [Rhodovulum sp.]|nr:hypothetical protein [Rhodovulum sp.]
MFFRTQSTTASATRATYSRGTVHCGRCGTPNDLYRVEAVADEFSVRCGSCGHRGFYRKSELGVSQLPERRRRPR